MSVFLPFKYDILPFPEHEKWLASGLNEVPETSWQSILTIIQPWRSDFLKLQKAGFTCQPAPPDTKVFYDGALLELCKHKGQNQNRFLDLLQQVKYGGKIIIQGDKTSGVASFLKWVQNITLVEDKISKNHGISFWLNVPDRQPDIASLYIKSEKVDGHYQTEPGMFSFQKIDQGSAMLLAHLDKQIFGRTADFGTGWGYLANELLKKKTKLAVLDLYEADFHALDMAKRNVQSDLIPLTFHWHDLKYEPVTEIYDTIISNPPFHEGRARDISLGQRFIEVAAKRLKPGGHLVMVANRQLPYESILQTNFRKIRTLEEANGFKVIEAAR